MRHVRCLFFVQQVTTHNALPGAARLLSARVGPTYAKRDGEVVSEHKSFWEATPSGNGLLEVPEDAPIAGLLQPGGYFYMDMYDFEPEPTEFTPLGMLRTDWKIDHLEVHPGQFKPHLTPLDGSYQRDQGRDNGRNVAMFGTEWKRQTFLEFSVTNVDAYPFFELRPTKIWQPKRIVIDFSFA